MSVSRMTGVPDPVAPARAACGTMNAMADTTRHATSARDTACQPGRRHGSNRFPLGVAGERVGTCTVLLQKTDPTWCGNLRHLWRHVPCGCEVFDPSRFVKWTSPSDAAGRA